MKTTDQQYAQAREAAKARIISQGKTYEQVADEIGHPRWLVNQVLNGISKAKYGKAHACAVALGIKAEQRTEAA
ncbi:hypothetical protein DTO96_102176 [Ephemeroptericola cinctiostellae]|uniref:HTH cro/C1-type domain-containing protein n=1 Tax=Ephemeroptericola cinctiostellae TaxID=2268024 RepID=A0A345DDI4_9BURK|nr:helix-turn-helix domain-containing protein [Ephemeroptericola cinctiostellae]AXF86422.1 hypothetical protein DTO96_102176 [Ephemeroptericola cinctiostellae]